MKEFRIFYFEKFVFDTHNGKASFEYSFDQEEYFHEIIEVPLGYDMEGKNEHIINNILFSLHIALGVSYYKLFPTKKLVIKSRCLDSYQKVFWRKFYLNGLGEFFITNRIDPVDILCFENYKTDNEVSLGCGLREEIQYKKSLLLFGGGKDTIVSYSILKDTLFDLFIFGKEDMVKKGVANVIGKQPICVKRNISPRLFEFNEKGYYNGHVPITGIIAFVSYLYAYLYNYGYIIVSNEKSSSQGNINWKGMKINHQYSKSFEFEEDFFEYSQMYFSPKVCYFSILSGMYEYKIANIFSSQKEFFPYFSSCNGNFTIHKQSEQNHWCNDCPKCAFVFLILSNFLDIDELQKIFGENLFEKESLVNIFGEIIGIKDHKPFECVGTLEESTMSFYKALQKYNKKNYFVLKYWKKSIENTCKNLDMKKEEEKLLKIYDSHIIPKEFKKLIP